MKHFSRCLRAISPVLAVLMMIAVAIAGALVTYAWVMGYIGFQTQKSGEAIQINSVTNDGDDLLVYVQNVGESVVQLDEGACLYVDGVLVHCDISNVSVTQGVATLGLGETATLRYVGGAAVPGERIHVKVTTKNGIPAEQTSYPGGSVRLPSSLDHFEFDYVSSPKTVDLPFTITIRAFDQYGELFTGYGGINDLSVSGGNMTPTLTGSFTDGVWYDIVTVTEVGTSLTISTQSRSDHTKTGTSNAFVVNVEGPGWNHTYGEAFNNEYARSIVLTSDGGYAIAGSIHYSGSSESDCLLVKVDEFGNMEWNQTFGRPDYDFAMSVVVASDGGYVIVGGTEPSLGPGDEDLLLVKFDEFGNLEWNKTYGSSGIDRGESLVAVDDGGYVVCGKNDGAFWLFKTDELGNMEWSRTYGGIEDCAYALVATSDGGYAVVGYTYLFDEGNADVWLVKTDAYGNIEWDKTYGGASDDRAYALVENSGGGYTFAGYTESFGAGKSDCWLVEVDKFGNMEWSQTFGGAEIDWAMSMIATSDGGYALAGFTESFSVGLQDWLFIKTGPYGNMEWNRTYGEVLTDRAWSLVESVDAKYIIAGYTGDSLWLIKTK